MNADDFDKKFDDGVEDVIDDLDLSTERRPYRDVKRVSVDLPLWMVDALDNEAVRLAVTRQSVIKAWLSERIDQNWRAVEVEEARRKARTG